MEKSKTRNGRALAILTKSHLALVEYSKEGNASDRKRR